MARKQKVRREIPKVEKNSYPSRFGSHTTMVNKDMSNDLKDDHWVICEDELGVYVTMVSRLDNGLADPYRFSTGKKNRKEMLDRLRK